MSQLNQETRHFYQEKMKDVPDGQPPLSKVEIHDILSAAGAKATDKDVELAYELLMNTWSRENRFEDFMLFIEQLCSVDSNAILRELFDSLDANNDGVLQYEEVLNGFAALGIEISEAELNQIFTEADENGNQLLEFDEFVKVIGRYT